MSAVDHSAGFHLLKTAALVDFRVGEPVIQACTDGENLALEVDITLGDDPEEEEPADVVEWAAFGLIFALAELSFADARPRGIPTSIFWRTTNLR